MGRFFLLKRTFTCPSGETMRFVKTTFQNKVAYRLVGRSYNLQFNEQWATEQDYIDYINKDFMEQDNE